MSTNFIKRIPSEPGRWRAIILALVMHLILLVVLWFSVSWQNQKPVAVEAEIWSPQSTVAAPPPPPVPVAPPQPAPEPVKAPEPIKKAEPVKPVKSAPADNIKKTADIALEKEKKRKEEKELKEKAEAAKKEKLAKEKEKEKQETDKLAELLRKKQAEEAKKLEEAERKKQAEEEKRKLAEEQRQKQEEAAAAQRAKARHEEDMRRLASEASGAGNAEKASSGKPDAAYARKIASLIRSNTMVSLNDISGNPTVEFRIDLLPDGSLRDVQLKKSSGVEAFDQAVRRAIDRAAPFPPDPTTGRVPSSIVISHRPKD